MSKGRATSVWLLWVDHSVSGVFVSKSAARRAAKARAKDSLLEVEYHVLGPYVLRGTR